MLIITVSKHRKKHFSVFLFACLRIIIYRLLQIHLFQIPTAIQQQWGNSSANTRLVEIIFMIRVYNIYDFGGALEVLELSFAKRWKKPGGIVRIVPGVWVIK